MQTRGGSLAFDPAVVAGRGVRVLDGGELADLSASYHVPKHATTYSLPINLLVRPRLHPNDPRRLRYRELRLPVKAAARPPQQPLLQLLLALTGFV